MFVGESEKNIAKAFEEAKKQKKILLFDEVDSFFRERSYSSQSWEITQVNEFLTQMEKFEGIVICTTNLWNIRKMNTSLQVFATIGEDFELPSGCDSGALVHAKLSEATQPKKNSNDDFVKLQEKLNQIVGSLEPFEQKVISMRFGLGDEHSHTLEEVGLAFDISLKKIRVIEAKALGLLRKNVASNDE